MKSTPPLRHLLLNGPRSAVDLASTLGISQPTFSRLVKSSGTENVRAFGRGRETVYGALRTVLGLGPRFPLFRIDKSGKCETLGEIYAVENRGYIFESVTGKSEAFPGIPFTLSDARAQGYLGRAFADRNTDLGFPKRLPDWSEDQIFASLALRGEHLPGNLLVGEESFRRYHDEVPPSAIGLRARARSYESLAERSITGTIPGSSAGGDQPKFPAFVENRGHVLVKFSPPLNTPKGRRWGDLLIAESIALKIIESELGLKSAPSEIITGDSRTFLDSSRFDRVGAHGRTGCLSFAAIESEWIGSPSNWAASAKDLLRMNRISKSDAEGVALLDAFGEWIANTDRHYGNLSFFYEPGDDHVRLAPAYDMLPMFFAPRETEGDVFKRDWSAPRPGPETLDVWEKARNAAKVFWAEILGDSRISADFKREAEQVRKKSVDPRSTLVKA